MREIKNECLGSGKITVSSTESNRGWIHCSACGKVIKIRANRENEATVSRHSRKGHKMTKGYKAGIKIDKTNREFTYNQLVFRTESEAREYVRDVEFTFDLLLFTHIVATTENPNYTYVDGKMEPINA